MDVQEHPTLPPAVARLAADAQGTLTTRPGPGIVTQEMEDNAELVKRTSLLPSIAHLAVDLFPRTPEREYAMVTRTVVALASGLPVIHPPFTEVSPLIEGFGAGWLLEAEDHTGLSEVLTAIGADRTVLQARARGARRLAAERLEPGAAVTPLVEILESA